MQNSGPVVVRVDAVTKRYREGDTEHVVLDGVSAGIDRGQFVVLAGPSGAGKSTLLNIISGMDLPDAGDVFLGGTALNRLTERERTLFRRERMGFVFQFFNLIPTLTVLENVVLPLELNGRTGADEQARAMLERVGLERRADAYPDRLSGGEQQRVAIARALVHEPLIVLADEPTGNLDDENAEAVLDILESVTRQVGRTLLVVTHSDEIVRRADRVLTLRHGHIEERVSSR
jgi:putative ABC transport system ATP-binding protein